MGKAYRNEDSLGKLEYGRCSYRCESQRGMVSTYRITWSTSCLSSADSWCRDGNDGPWSTFTLGIGTPPQYVRVLISTTCPQPWAVDPLGCTAIDPATYASNRGGLFNKNHSSTWQDQGFYELDQELNLGYTGNGDFGSDSITLGYPGSGAITVEHQLLATIAAKDFYIATWGIAPRATNLSRSDSDPATLLPENSHQSLLSMLKQQHEIPSLAYGYTAGARYRMSPSPLSIIVFSLMVPRTKTSCRKPHPWRLRRLSFCVE